MQLLLRLAASGALMAGLFLLGGLEEFRGITRRIDWSMLGPFVVLTAVLVSIFACRWWLLLGSAITFRRSLAATVAGLGANMVLPARGGDLLRAYHSAHHRGARGHLVIAKLLLEKLLDLGTVLLVGTLALVLLGVHTQHGAVVWSAVAVTGALVVFLVLVRTHSAWLGSAIRAVLGTIRLGHVYDRHLHRLLEELTEGLSARKLAGPVLLSLAMWLTAYAAAYIVCAKMVGIPLAYLESLVLLLAASIGLAVPAAPSGLGTFHAAVASGFVVLGRPLAEGLVLAVALHGCFFVVLLVPAVAVYALGWVDRIPPAHAEAPR
jgi:uncharacterized protein (TIRG00374 family)